MKEARRRGVQFGRKKKLTPAQDFRSEDMYYLRAGPNAKEFEKSIYPAYHFRMSARDLARFGYLYLQNGTWNGRQSGSKGFYASAR